MNCASVVHRLSAARPPGPLPSARTKGGEGGRGGAGRGSRRGQRADEHAAPQVAWQGQHRQASKRAGMQTRPAAERQAFPCGGGGDKHMGRPQIRPSAARRPPGAAAAASSAAPPSHRGCGSPFAAAAAASAGCRAACSSISSNGQQGSAAQAGRKYSMAGRGAGCDRWHDVSLSLLLLLLPVSLPLLHPSRRGSDSRQHTASAHLQARLRVVGQMPRRFAASFSPTPNCPCRSASVSRTPGLPAAGRAGGRQGPRHAELSLASGHDLGFSQCKPQATLTAGSYMAGYPPGLPVPLRRGLACTPPRWVPPPRLRDSPKSSSSSSPSPPYSSSAAGSTVGARDSNSSDTHDHHGCVFLAGTAGGSGSSGSDSQPPLQAAAHPTTCLPTHPQHPPTHLR